MRKLLLGLIGLLFTIPAVATDSGAISSVTVAGLVAQNGTPTPTTPIDIVSNNGVLKASQNLFDMNLLLQASGWTVSNGVYSGAVGHLYSIYKADLGGFPISFASNTQYTLSGRMTKNGGERFQINYTDGTVQNVYGNGMDQDFVVTTTSGKTIQSVSFNYGSSSTIQMSNIQLELGSTATTYRPYGQIYTDGEVETIGDSANHTANVATLLGVGDNRDTQNINTGAITRRVGVKVLDGTEDWKEDANSFYLDGDYNGATAANLQLSSHYKYNGNQSVASLNTTTQAFYVWGGGNRLRIRDTTVGSLTDFTDFLAAQYANGTPVIVIYPLETPTTESVAGQTMTMAPVSNKTGGVTGMTITTLLSSGASVVTTIAADAIKIATTAYNSARFSPVVTELNDTIATIRSVVTNTINQTKAIADLQATKQTRPDETCPAGKKCLLVEDNDGQPHWYEIIENAD